MRWWEQLIKNHYDYKRCVNSHNDWKEKEEKNERMKNDFEPVQRNERPVSSGHRPAGQCANVALRRRGVSEIK